MRKCPFCLGEIPEDAKVCKHCNSTVVKSCPACSKEILATAKKCRYCAAELDGAKPAVLRADAPCGERREIVMSLVLIFVTCGIYGLVMQYRMGKELNAHVGRNEVNPGLDLLLIFLTCGLWVFYVMIKYPRMLEDAIAEEGGKSSDLILPCLLLTMFGMHIVALLILQGELNKHWEIHASLRT
jgi:hypothetical protein